jgi:hypothetical protein
MVLNIFWTGMTKTGCSGQYSNCFGDDSNVTNDRLDVEIMENRVKGACVGVTAHPDGVLARTLGCETKLLLACQGRKNTVALPAAVI